MSTATTEAAKRFFRAPQYAVAGASQDTSKYGYKLLAWYTTHSLPVTPINPKSPLISLSTVRPPAAPLQSVSSPSALAKPAETSLSVVTPPAVTKAVLREAREIGIRAVWLQPGSFDEEGLELAKTMFESAVAGEEDGVGGEGWCVLVHGEAARREGRSGAAL